MVDVRKPAIRPFALEGNFGLEREALRVTKDGRMAQTPHPFPPDHPRIVRDFCEIEYAVQLRDERRAVDERGPFASCHDAT